MKKSFKTGEKIGKNIRSFIINKLFTKKFNHDYDEKPSFIMDIFKSINTNDAVFKKRIKNDKEFIMDQVKKNGFALNFINEELKNNFDIVSEAVKQNGFSILFASDELKKDKEIIKIAVEQLIKYLKSIHTDIINLLCLYIHADIDYETIYTIFNDEDSKLKQIFQIENFEEFLYQIQGKINKLNKDIENINKNLISINTHISINPELLSNEEYLLKLKDYIKVYNYQIKRKGEIEYDKKKIFDNIYEPTENKKVLEEQYKKKEQEINDKRIKVLELFKKLDYKNNYEVCLKVIELNGNALEFAGDEIKKNNTIVEIALKQQPLALKFALK